MFRRVCAGCKGTARKPVRESRRFNNVLKNLAVISVTRRRAQTKKHLKTNDKKEKEVEEPGKRFESVMKFLTDVTEFVG